MTEHSTTERDSTIAEIRAVFNEMYAGWADNDADAFVRAYREDATVIMPGVRHLAGPRSATPWRLPSRGL